MGEISILGQYCETHENSVRTESSQEGIGRHPSVLTAQERSLEMLNRILRFVLIISISALIAVAAGCAKPQVALQVSRDKIEQGQDVKVSWTSKDAKNVTVNGEKVDKVGSKVVSPQATTTYLAVATRGKKEARDSKTVDVSSRGAHPSISISADPEGIVRGQSTTLRWHSSNAERVSITDVGNVPPSGSRAVSPSTSTTYTATATGPGGSDDASTRVTVSEEPSRTPTHVDTGGATGMGISGIFGQNVRMIFFSYDKAELLPEAKETLRRAAQWLTQGRYRTITFRIEGSCDPRGTEEYNIGLGERRAQAAREFLSSLGVDPSRATTVSMGKEQAAGTHEGTPDNPPSWAHDRHDLFVYLSGGSGGSM
jgi:peptidoglycan-associated lipoprotein